MASKKKRERGEEGKRGKGSETNNLSPFSRLPLSNGITVSIIGAGRLGAALGIALAARGFRIEEVVARHLSHARKAARLIGPDTRALSSAQLEKLKPASILFITTPDDAIEETARQLASSIAWDGRGHVALHASGALSSESLHALSAKGFHTGSMHPLISVSEPLKGAHALAHAHYCIEGHAQAVKHARTLIRKLGGRSFSINTKDKALYHAAAVMSSGHMVALFDIAAEMLTRCGLSDKESRAALLPLILSTLENLSRHPPAQALTGTFARADVTTVFKHLDALGHLKSRDALAAYLLLGQRSLELAKKNKADAQALRKIARSLKEFAEKENESPAKAQRRKESRE